MWTASIVVMSLASYGISVAGTIIADLSSARNIGRSLGTFRFVGDIGLIVAPALSAWLYEHFGTRPSILPLAGLLVLVGVAGALVLPETRWLEAKDA
jgi:MFS family permease